MFFYTLSGRGKKKSVSSWLERQKNIKQQEEGQKKKERHDTVLSLSLCRFLMADWVVIHKRADCWQRYTAQSIRPIITDGSHPYRSIEWKKRHVRHGIKKKNQNILFWRFVFKSISSSGRPADDMPANKRSLLHPLHKYGGGRWQWSERLKEQAIIIRLWFVGQDFPARGRPKM